MTPHDVAFWTTYPIAFHGGSLAERPLGGCETAIVEVARRLSSRGLRVAVYCHLPPGGGGTWEGVVYASGAEAKAALASGHLRAGTLVVMRDPSCCHLGRAARRTLLWIQDMPMEGLRRQHQDALPFIDRILAVSKHQRDRFIAAYGLPEDRFLVTRNGVDQPRYRPWGTRIPGRLIYASTPFRGLAILLDAFPAIRAARPEAELHVYSGMANYDQDDAPFAALLARAAATPGVVLHRPVPQPSLVAALREADLMVYPATFHETSCIAAMMAIAAGAPVVASDRGALPETVGDCGLVVPGDGRREPGYAARFAAAVAELLGDSARLAALRARCLERDLDWDAVIDAWWPDLRPG